MKYRKCWAGLFTASALTTMISVNMVLGAFAQTSDYSGTYSGVLTVSDSKSITGGSYTSTTSDQSVVLIEEGGALTMDGTTVTKESGDSSNTENSEFYGVNAAILATAGSSAEIKNATISTKAKGANAVFATGSGTKIEISDSTITSTGSGSARGLDATYGGEIDADNVTITTSGGSCAAAATDRGEGTVTVKNSDLTTNGAGSPVVYSTGDITLDNTKGCANGAQIAVVEGKNSATIKNGSSVTASAAGNRGDTDVAGVMIYQSMSGDAGTGKGTFSASDSTLTIDSESDYYETAPMFFITNTDAQIDLSNTVINYGSGVLVSEKGTSEWGSSGSNGGNLTLNATNQTLEGDIVPDAISTVTLNLSDGSSYEGAINSANAGDVAIVLDASSSIKLTADAYVTSIDDADTTQSNIDLNGYSIHIVDAKVDTSSNSGGSSSGQSGSNPGGQNGSNPGGQNGSNPGGPGGPGGDNQGNPPEMPSGAGNGPEGGNNSGSSSLGSSSSASSSSSAILIKKVKVGRIAPQEYTGSEIEPELTITYKKNILTEGTDYKLTYTNNINAGKAQVVIVGINDYTGSITKRFKITRKKMNSSDIKITVSSNSADSSRPSVTVRDDEQTLSAGDDYKVKYKTTKNSDTGVVTVKGIGNYTGSVKKKFTI